MKGVAWPRSERRAPTYKRHTTLKITIVCSLLISSLETKGWNEETYNTHEMKEQMKGVVWPRLERRAPTYTRRHTWVNSNPWVSSVYRQNRT